MNEIFLDKIFSKNLYDFQLNNAQYINRYKGVVVTLRNMKESKMPHDIRINQLRMMHDAIKSCMICPNGRSLHKLDCGMEVDPHVFSNINKSKFMIVAQNPGSEECIKNTPLVGQSGKNLDQAMAMCNISRDDFYITNAVKCHTLHNRPPFEEEIYSCSSWLELELRILKPILVVVMGHTAFHAFFPEESFMDSINKIIESDKFHGMKFNVLPTYHPSPINLDNTSKSVKFYKSIEVLSKIVHKYKEKNK